MPNDLSELQTDKGVSIGQPWATLVAAGIVKEFKLRQTYTYRGRIAIHASMITPTKDEDKFCKQPDIAKLLAKCGYRGFSDEHGSGIYLLPRGGIVGTAELIDIIPNGGGEYRWLFQNAKPLPELLPARGAFGIFDIHRAAKNAKPRSGLISKRYKK